MKKLYIVDASAMFFRAFYAIRPLTSPSGLPTNAIYGFLSMLTKLIKSENPDHLVFCYDRKEPSFRKEMYSEYKANRTEMPEDLVPQIPYIKKMGVLMGIPSLELAPYEADDLIGTLTKLGREKGFEVFIVSGDKDFGQLVAPHVYLYDTMKDVKYDVSGVKEKWGISPEHFIDYLAIVGDSSDNVPGVAGLGPKGAQKLIEEYGSLENIYEHLDDIKSASVKQKLVDSRDLAFLSKKLVTIVTDAPIPQDLEYYHTKPVQRSEFREFLRELNFKNFEKSLLGDADQDIKLQTRDEATSSDVMVSAVGAAESEASVDRGADEAASDFEKIEVKEIDCLEFVAWIRSHSASDPLKLWHLKSDYGLYFAHEQSLFVLRGSLSDLKFDRETSKKIKWCGFDLKSFWHSVETENPQLEIDLQLMAYVVRAQEIETFEKTYQQFVAEEIPPLIAAEQLYRSYLKLEQVLRQELGKVSGEKILNELDVPLAPILFHMEKAGITIDDQLLRAQSSELAHDIREVEKKIHEAAGEHFNVASPKQLGFVLFEKLKLPVVKKTKTGYSTDNEVLEAIDHPIAKLVIDFREMSKLKSTYVDALPALISEKDHRVHTQFNQALTATGRLSSTHPNLQNIPIRTERGARVRRAFIPSEGNVLVSVDYSQIELRILAHFSQDPNLIRAFEDDLDIHAATAAEVFQVPLKDVSSDLRRTAKAINFGIAYGQGAFGLAENLGIGRKEAQEIIANYFQKFPGVREYIDSTIKQAHEKGYVETLLGRRRYIPELQAKNGAIKKFGERAAINAPIQGTASDLVKKAMIDVFAVTKMNLLLQVHDELIFEAPEEIAQSEKKIILEKMESVMKLRAPLKANWAVGKNWDEAH